MELNGAHVVVTGASRGIGAAMVKQFTDAGSRVSLVARSADAIEALATKVNGHAFPADLLDPDQVDALIPRIEEEAGAVDVLVNNAGIETRAWFNEVPAADIRAVTQLNLEAPMVLSRAALPGMLERNRGHLVFTSSVAGTAGFPGLAAYSASKAGITNFAAALRMELRDTNINLTVAAPGPVDTQMWDNLEDQADFAPMLKRLNRLQLIPKKTPEFIAEQMVLAVQADKRHVYSPRRLASNTVLRESPTRLIEALLSGVPIGPKVSPQLTTSD